MDLPCTSLSPAFRSLLLLPVFFYIATMFEASDRWLALWCNKALLLSRECWEPVGLLGDRGNEFGLLTTLKPRDENSAICGKGDVVCCNFKLKETPGICKLFVVWTESQLLLTGSSAKFMFLTGCSCHCWMLSNVRRLVYTLLSYWDPSGSSSIFLCSVSPIRESILAT